MKIIVEIFNLELGKRIASAAPAVRAYIDRVAFRPGVEKIARAARLFAPQAETGLVNAIRAQQLGLNVWEVVANKIYASAVEHGAAPGGSPPIRSLVDWIRVKRIKPNDPEMSVNDLAFVMQRSIRRFGTAAQPFMRPAIEQEIPGVLNALELALTEGLRREVHG